jgi:hypothetical protein
MTPKEINNKTLPELSNSVSPLAKPEAYPNAIESRLLPSHVSKWVLK